MGQLPHETYKMQIKHYSGRIKMPWQEQRAKLKFRDRNLYIRPSVHFFGDVNISSFGYPGSCGYSADVKCGF